MFSAIGFDVSNFIIGAVLYSGACLSVIPEEIRFNMAEMNDYFISHGVTHAFITTQVGKIFMESVADTSLDVLLVAGEKLGNVESPDDYELVDGFGPTEAFAFMSSIRNSEKIIESSVGYLNYNTKAYVLDNEGRQVPFGAVGELCLAGYQIDNVDYEVLYHTGDMVRLLPDGSIGLVGRRDSQVKIRGNRVELAEVESVIRSMDEVNDITVQTVNNNGNNELVAYVVLSQNMDSDKIRDAVCNYVAEFKPDYMVPSFVVELDDIPLNVNGKVDKRALPEVDMDSLFLDYVAPTNDVERDIVDAFKKVFGKDKIGIYDDFIRLGGDSLTAIKLLPLLEDYNITAADILSLHTPYTIAKNINNISLDLDIYSIQTGCPLNESQLNVYLDIIANDKTSAYIMPLSMEISKEYDVDSIIDALDEMLKVHPILSMCVSDEFEVPYLVKRLKPSIIFKSDASDDYIGKFISQSFDLYKNLSRFLIVEKEDKYLLFAVFHHIIFDALSNNVFITDLLKILDGKSINLDDSFLKASAFAKQIQNTDEYNDAYEFYDSLLADAEESSTLIDSISSDESGDYHGMVPRCNQQGNQQENQRLQKDH